MPRMETAPRARDQSAARVALETLAPEPVEDLSRLEPPEPLERVLMACAQLAPGEVYCARLPRTPTMLFPQLEARGLEWRVAAEPEGTAVIWVRDRVA